MFPFIGFEMLCLENCVILLDGSAKVALEIITCTFISSGKYGVVLNFPISSLAESHTKYISFLPLTLTTCENISFIVVVSSGTAVISVKC